ncbi:MAG: Wzz/FepE/Etk N-terminal domain-containing protein [Desulfobacterales bacterium]
MEENPKIQWDLVTILRVLSRRRWWVIGSLALAVLTGIVLTLTLPKLYEASTLILVQRQRVPEKYVQPVVASDLENRISTISQQILSRSNLERMIERYNLFAGEEFRNVLLDDKIESLRKRITVEVSRSRRDREADAFTISFRDRDPHTAMRVANGLASHFIDENLKVREAQAMGTSDFLEAELESTRKRLEELEKELKDYRIRHMGELPEQLDANLRVLDRLNAQLNEKEQSLRSARVNLAALIEAENFARQAVVVPSAPPAPTGRETEETMSLPQLRERLAALLSSYTENHPDVVRVKNRIAKLEAAGRGAETGQAGSPGPAPVLSAAEAERVRQKAVLEGVIRNLEGDIARLHREIREYQARVDAAPRREQELLTLKRDYELIRSSYNSLLNRKQEADIAVNMERKQKGEQFQILDPARLPEKPTAPDLRRVFAITLAAAFALAGGLVFLVEMSDTSIRRPGEAEERFQLPVLAAVNWIEGPADRTIRRLRNAATAASLLLVAGLTAGFAWLVFGSPDPTLQALIRHASL